MGAVSRPHLFSYNWWLCFAVSQDARTFFVFRNQSCFIDQQLLMGVARSCQFNCLERAELTHSPEVHVQEKDMFSAVHVPIRYDPVSSEVTTNCSNKFARLASSFDCYVSPHSSDHLFTRFRGRTLRAAWPYSLAGWSLHLPQFEAWHGIVRVGLPPFSSGLLPFITEW